MGKCHLPSLRECLSSLFSDRVDLTLWNVKYILREILKGLEYLHSKRVEIVHGNLKCECTHVVAILCTMYLSPTYPPIQSHSITNLFPFIIHVIHFVPCPLPLQYKTSWLMFVVTVKVFSNVLMKGTVGTESTYLILIKLYTSVKEKLQNGMTCFPLGYC